MKKIVSKVKKELTMKCTYPNTDLIFYAEGSFSKEKMSVVESHLIECEECTALLETLKRALTLIEKEKLTTFDPYFYTRHLTRRHERERKSTFIINRFVPALVAATLFTGGVLTGLNIGKLIPATQYKSEEVLTQERGYIDELGQESIESFFLTLNNGENE